ncbi:PTS sugar transporter subunit IIA [Aerococcaceae bacterium DSM 111020]|nr:PTS sugar transporter subunit IIA [Aerococcaceae bacterium DSM 111020]
MLTYFKDNDLVYYPDKNPENWQEAIRLCCMKLEEHGYITGQYIEEIIASVEKHGPYIVIVPQVAMPHAEASSEGVLGTAISFTKFSKPVIFYDEEYQEEKPATLFFTLAAKNPDEHLENITKLMELLSDDTIVEKLLETRTLDEYMTLID